MVEQTSGVVMVGLIDMRPKGERVIDGLRRQKPGRWVYDRKRHCWKHESGLEIVPCATYSPRYDGDDHMVTVYMRTDTNEDVDPWWGIGLDNRYRG